MTQEPDVRAAVEGQGAELVGPGGRSARWVAIAGAGKVGRSIAAELLENGSEVMIIERDPNKIRRDALPAVEWLLADACELSSLDGAGLDRCAVMVAATGDDKVNLVVSLLAKTEFGVPRVVARVNHPKNEWLFTDSWGVDVAVSAPRLLTALVEEAVSVGDLVRLMKFRQSDASLVELTLTANAPVVGLRVGDVDLPPDSALVVILRDGHAIVPSADCALEPGDEVLAVATTSEAEESLAALLGAVPAGAARGPAAR
ncbi:potassium channel family protein [Parafrankia elaeagni]|uniref:potassium channel family protein n=1 Tax=Parafrankia elaeagni TaxID=222534 RepID=UPI0003728B98|nr:TrkA family potassium uptake protein [Parafrankia elaeagni]